MSLIFNPQILTRHLFRVGGSFPPGQLSWIQNTHPTRNLNRKVQHVCLEAIVQRGSLKSGVLRNLTKFKGKDLWQGLCSNKVTRPATLLQKETLARVFSCECCQISKKTIYTEHFWWLLLFII